MYYGWRIVIGCFLMQAFVMGFFSYSVSLLTHPVQQSFDASVEQVMYSLTIGTFSGLLAMPIAGALLDRFSARLLSSLGLIFFAGGIFLISHAQSITQYAIFFGITMALANAFSGALVSSTVISRWFVANRGTALGISASGTSAGGAIIPMLMAFWLSADGQWRSALQNMSIVILLVVLPIAIVTIRSWPKDLGIEPMANDHHNNGSIHSGRVLTTREILTDKNFWLLGVALGLLFSAYMAILSNITPYVLDLEHNKEVASLMIMIIAISGMAGKIGFGVLADKIPHKTGLWLAQFCIIIGLLILSTEPKYGILMLASALIGLASGGMLPIWGAWLANLFGIANYGRAMGLMGPITTLCVMPSFPITGLLFDSTGSYVTALLAFSGVALLSGLLLLPIKSHVNSTPV